MRVIIAPLNSPNYQKNYNTGGRIGYERLEDARIANIKIFHDEERKSQPGSRRNPAGHPVELEGNLNNLIGFQQLVFEVSVPETGAANVLSQLHSGAVGQDELASWDRR